MLKRGTIIRLSNNQEYYVVESVVLDGVTYFYLATTDEETIDLMFVTCNIIDGEKVIDVVSDQSLLYRLTQSLSR